MLPHQSLPITTGAKNALQQDLWFYTINKTQGNVVSA